MSTPEQLPDPDEFGMLPPKEMEVEPETPGPASIPYIIPENTYLDKLEFPVSEESIHEHRESYHEREFFCREELWETVRMMHELIMYNPGYFSNVRITAPNPEPAKPIEKPDPYPSRAGWRADYVPSHDPFAEDPADKPKGKIGEYEIVESATTFDDVGGNAVAKDLLTEIAAQFETPELYTKWDVPVPKGVLLHGGPGTGKTMLAKAFANAANAAFVEVPVAGLRSKYYGETEKNLKGLFDEAAKHKGQVVLFFDEIDSLLPDRSGFFAGGVDTELVNTFLQAMDGMRSVPNVMVLGATNYPDRLDSAATRPGRFDQKVKVELPDRTGCREIAAKQLLRAERNAGRALAVDELNLEEISQYLEGLSGADIAEVLNRVKRSMVQTERAMGKAIEVSEDGSSVSFEDEEREAIKITTDDIVAAAINYRLRG